MTQHYIQPDSSPSVAPPSLHGVARAKTASHAPRALQPGAALAQDPSLDAFAAPRAVAWLRRTAMNLAAQDLLILGYFVVMFLAVAFGSGPNRETQLLRIGADVALLGTGLALTRGGLLPEGRRTTELVYRLTIFGTFFLSYFQLQYILPAVSARAVDADIVALDQHLFGYEPALAWDRYVTPATTEWFAFFYFGYFGLLAANVLPFLLVHKDQDLTARFSLGIYTVFCASHLLYMVVPGFGPYRFLAHAFEHKLEGGLFWRLVVETVTGAGAQKDIFPSLHTGAPTYFTLFAFRNRHRLPFKYAWPLSALFTSQIIIATMFLRWHYLIDIFAGLSVATFAAFASPRIEAWDRARRERHGLQPIFGPPPARLR